MTEDSRKRRRRSGERAQSMVEFAFIFPLFLVLILAIVDFAWAMRAEVIITNATREGARYGVVCPEGNPADSVEAVKDRVAEKLVDLDSTASVTAIVPCDTGEEVTVTTAYTYEYISPLGGIINFISGGTFPDSLSMGSSTTMRSE